MEPVDGGSARGGAGGKRPPPSRLPACYDLAGRGEMGFFPESGPHVHPPRFRGTWFAPPRGLCLFHAALGALFLLIAVLALVGGGASALLVVWPIVAWSALNFGVTWRLAGERRLLTRCVSLQEAAEAAGAEPGALARYLAEAGVLPRAVVNGAPAYLAVEAAPALSLLRPSDSCPALLRPSATAGHAAPVGLLRASPPEAVGAPGADEERAPERLTTCTSAHRNPGEA
ncbi:MAG TPA: hypothetical protein VLH79_07650 [Chthonomonadales bacterium]|nr:hypothetical protein [Chthonomonadales bacterium]